MTSRILCLDTTSLSQWSSSREGYCQGWRAATGPGSRLRTTMWRRACWWVGGPAEPPGRLKGCQAGQGDASYSQLLGLLAGGQADGASLLICRSFPPSMASWRPALLSFLSRSRHKTNWYNPSSKSMRWSSRPFQGISNPPPYSFT